MLNVCHIHQPAMNNVLFILLVSHIINGVDMQYMLLSARPDSSLFRSLAHDELVNYTALALLLSSSVKY